jgi:hypothetical protein
MNNDFARLQNLPPWEWPPTAAATFLQVLQDPRNPLDDRILATELAGDLVAMDDGVAQHLLTLLRDPHQPDSLRAQAAISLGPALEDADTQGFEDEWSDPAITEPVFEQIQTTLHDIHQDPSIPTEVRRRALEAAVRAPQDWHTTAINEANASPHPDWNLTAAFCMRWIRGFDTQIVDLVQSPNPEIRREAVQAAGNWTVLPAWPHIAPILSADQPDKDLLVAAIGAAGSLRLDEARDLLDDLVDCDDDEIADAASEALMDMEGGPFEDEEDDEDDFDDDFDPDDDLEDEEEDEEKDPNPGKSPF